MVEQFLEPTELRLAAGVVVVNAGYDAAFLTLAAGVGLMLFLFAMPEMRPVDQPRTARPAMSVA